MEFNNFAPKPENGLIIFNQQPMSWAASLAVKKQTTAEIDNCFTGVVPHLEKKFIILICGIRGL